MEQHNNTSLQSADDFIMSPKVDFAFKLIFGDEKNKDVLMDFLSKVLRVPTSIFEDLELVNVELAKEFLEDKKGILDVRIKTKDKKQIDIEIQVIQHKYMPERSLFYWSKMYTGQIKSGSTYAQLKKCITINVVDFKCIPVNKVHTSFHILEDETGHKLTDMLEIHFLELKKLEEDNSEDEEDPARTWLEFLNAHSKGEMEMIAEKDNNIKKAYEVLQVASMDEAKRLAYEAREAELMDQRTREEDARTQGRELGIQQGIQIERAQLIRNMLAANVSLEDIAKFTQLSVEEIEVYSS